MVANPSFWILPSRQRPLAAGNDGAVEKTTHFPVKCSTSVVSQLTASAQNQKLYERAASGKSPLVKDSFRAPN
jgi:hypothetical protein